MAKSSVFITLILGIACSINAADLAPPAQIFPPDGAVLTRSIPRFEWQRAEVLNPDAVSDCEIQIAPDEKGADVLDRDRIAGVIGWYVPDRELPPGNYTWRVAAVGAEGKPGTWSPARKFEIRQPEQVLPVLRDRKGMLVSEGGGYAMKRGVPLVVPHDGCEPIEGRRFRFRFGKEAATRVFAIGDICVLAPRWLGEAGGHGSAVNGGEDVVFFNLTIRSAANECLGSFYANRLAILNVRLERSAGRALSVNNGGYNHHNARTGPWIEGCLFENCGDDVCHVNGYAMSVASQPGPDRLRINYGKYFDQFGVQAKLDFRIGDHIQFYDAGQGRLLMERRVVEAVAEEKTLLVRLDGPVEGLITGRLSINKKADYAAMDDVSVTHVFNASRMCSQFVFRHNVARNSRRVGVLAKGDGGLIEGNTFENLGGGGVEFWNAPFEGLAAENYVVRDNRIVNCGRIERKHAAIWATMFKSGGDKLHRNLLFERNEIIGFPGTAIMLNDVENAVVRENRIQASPSNSEAVLLNNTAKVQQTGNSIQAAQPTVAPCTKP